MEIDDKVAKNYDNMCPGFIWSRFTNKSIQERHGMKFWKFISQAFMNWWIDVVVKHITYLSDVTIESPSSYIKVGLRKIILGSVIFEVDYYHVL